MRPLFVRPEAEPTISKIGKHFERQARLRPESVALQLGERCVTYAVLDRMSLVVARHLRRHGVRAGACVGFVLTDRIAQVAAMLGILRAGAAYVPFDLANPQAVLSAMVVDSGIVAMLADASPAPQGDPHHAPARFWSVQTIAYPDDADTAEWNADADAHDAVDEATQPDLAYIMFTSGSTGRPKPVAVPHRGIVRLVVGADYVALGPDEVLLQLAPLAFDASTFEIWGALLNGGRLVLPPVAHPSVDDIGGLLSRYGITTLWLTAGLFHLMIDTRLEALRPLRQLLAGGDVLSPPHVGRALRALPGCRLVNGYGPTENTTFTCCYRIRPGDETGPIPIGTPIAGTTIHVLDTELRPVAPGEIGELYAGGDGVALGYLGLPDLTLQKFVADPFAASAEARLYRTGDLVRQRPDGNLEFHGRQDGQVKLDGKRVELAAIEAALREVSTADMRDVVVSVLAEPGGKRIVAHLLQPAAGGVGHDAPVRGTQADDALRAALREVLPPYMVPAAFMAHAEFPLTRNGKIDRAALDAAFTAAAQAVEPGTQAAPVGVEGAIAGIWGRILDLPSPPLDRNFFDLGGTSLQLMAIHAEMKTRFPDLDMTDLFARPTIASLAAHLSQNAGPAVSTLAARDRGARQRDAFARLRRERA